MSLSKQEFFRLMMVPKEWIDWGMYPDELVEKQIGVYEPGDERASEHYRNGAFHWWLKRNPSKDVLRRLARLTYLDPYPPMAQDVRGYIAKAVNCDFEITQMLDSHPTASL